MVEFVKAYDVYTWRFHSMVLLWCHDHTWNCKSQYIIIQFSEWFILKHCVIAQFLSNELRKWFHLDYMERCHKSYGVACGHIWAERRLYLPLAYKNFSLSLSLTRTHTRPKLDERSLCAPVYGWWDAWWKHIGFVYGLSHLKCQHYSFFFLPLLIHLLIMS